MLLGIFFLLKWTKKWMPRLNTCIIADLLVKNKIRKCEIDLC